MRMRTRSLMGAAALLACMVVPSRAIVGIGVHYGLDFSLSMDAAFNEPVAFQEFGVTQFTDFMGKFDTMITNQAGIPQTQLDSLYNELESSPANFSATLPILLSRGALERTPINMGGKFYIDIIPVLDAIELSFNVGVWEYDAYLKYPTGIDKSNITTDAIGKAFTEGDYSEVLVMNDSIPLTLDQFGIPYAFGLSGTPYTKLQFDLSIRKNIVALPKRMKILRIYAGGGPSMHFATPVVTPEMVEEVVGDAIESALENGAGDFGELQKQFRNKETLKPIVEKIVEGLAVPKFGLNILVGTHVKLPVVPIGFYVDGKQMIPFGPYDEAADLTGYGFLLNGGISVGL